MKNFGVAMEAFERSTHEKHLGWLGGQDDGMGDFGQDRSASARAWAILDTTAVVSTYGERIAKPAGKALRNVRWRWELINSAKDKSPLAWFSPKEAVMGL